MAQDPAYGLLLTLLAAMMLGATAGCNCGGGSKTPGNEGEQHIICAGSLYNEANVPINSDCRC
jgi:hypothetical protein